jgi:POT family proton-dependent oligopeptide transporter
MYGSLALVGLIAGVLFFVCFRKSDALDPMIQRTIEGACLEGVAVEPISKVTERGKHNKP